MRTIFDSTRPVKPSCNTFAAGLIDHPRETFTPTPLTGPALGLDRDGYPVPTAEDRRWWAQVSDEMDQERHRLARQRAEARRRIAQREYDAHTLELAEQSAIESAYLSSIGYAC